MHQDKPHLVSSTTKCLRAIGSILSLNALSLRAETSDPTQDLNLSSHPSSAINTEMKDLKKDQLDELFFHTLEVLKKSELHRRNMLSFQENLAILETHSEYLHGGKRSTPNEILRLEERFAGSLGFLKHLSEEMASDLKAWKEVYAQIQNLKISSPQHIKLKEEEDSSANYFRLELEKIDAANASYKSNSDNFSSWYAARSKSNLQSSEKLTQSIENFSRALKRYSDLIEKSLGDLESNWDSLQVDSKITFLDFRKYTYRWETYILNSMPIPKIGQVPTEISAKGPAQTLKFLTSANSAQPAIEGLSVIEKELYRLAQLKKESGRLTQEIKLDSAALEEQRSKRQLALENQYAQTQSRSEQIKEDIAKQAQVFEEKSDKIVEVLLVQNPDLERKARENLTRIMSNYGPEAEKVLTIVSKQLEQALTLFEAYTELVCLQSKAGKVQDFLRVYERSIELQRNLRIARMTEAERKAECQRLLVLVTKQKEEIALQSEELLSATNSLPLGMPQTPNQIK